MNDVDRIDPAIGKYQDNKVILDTPRIDLPEEPLNRGYLEVEDARALLIQSITAYCEKFGMKEE